MIPDSWDIEPFIDLWDICSNISRMWLTDVNLQVSWWEAVNDNKSDIKARIHDCSTEVTIFHLVGWLREATWPLDSPLPTAWPTSWDIVTWVPHSWVLAIIFYRSVHEINHYKASIAQSPCQRGCVPANIYFWFRIGPVLAQNWPNTEQEPKICWGSDTLTLAWVECKMQK